MPRQSTLGLVGESGCGKSTLLRVIAGLEPATRAGHLRRPGHLGAHRKAEAGDDKRIQVVFQDPESTLNPRKTIGQAIMRPIRLTGLRRKEAERATARAPGVGEPRLRVPRSLS